MKNKMTLGDKLREARIEQKFTQSSLAKDIVTRTMLSKLENNVATPSLDTIKKLAERLDKPVSYFLSEEMDDNIQNKGLVVYQHLSLLYKNKDYEKAIEYYNIPKVIDSLTDSEYYKCLLIICNCNLVLKNYSEVVEKMDLLIEYFSEVKDDYFLSKSYQLTSLYYFYQEKYFEASKQITLAIKALRLSFIDDPLYAIKLQYILGYSEYKNHDYFKAKSSLLKALSLSAESESSYRMGEIYMIMANIHKKNEDWHDAINYIKKAVKYFDLLENSKMIAICSANLGGYLFDIKEYEKSALAFKESIYSYEEIDLKTEANNVRTQLFSTSVYTCDINLLDQLISSIEEYIISDDYKASYYIHKAKYYLRISKYDEAKNLLHHYEKKPENKKQLLLIYEFLAEVYSSEENYKKAFEYSQKALDKTS